MIYWLQEATTAGGQVGEPSWLLSAGVIGATVSLIGLILAQLRHTQTLRQTRELEDTRRLEARDLETRRAGEAALQKYLEQMRDSLVDPKRPLHQSARGDVLRTVARAQTLAVREGLDPDRKGILLQFLQGADLITIDESIVSLARANLRKAKVDGANLQYADLRGAMLQEANLSEADLYRANLRKANLRAADLRGADLSEANLRNADLRGLAALSENELLAARTGVPSRVRGADLREATNLTQEQIDIAYGDETTLLPDHLQRPAHWKKPSPEEGEE